MPLVTAVRNPDIPVNDVALEVKVSLPPLNVTVICPFPLLVVGDSSVQMASSRLVPEVV